MKSPHVLALIACAAISTAVAAGPATQLRSFDIDDATAPRSQPVLAGSNNTTFAVTAIDDAGNPVPGATVTFSVGEGANCGSFSGQADAQVTADSTGRATSPPFTASTQTGDCSVVTAIAGRLPIVFDTPIFTAGDVRFISRQLNLTVLAGTDYPVSLGVQVQFPTGGVAYAPNVPVTIDVENSVLGASATVVGGSALTTDALGGLSFTLHANASNGNYNVVMHVLGSALSIPVTQFIQGNNMRLQFVKPVTNTVSGQPFEIDVDALAASGSPVTGVKLRLDYDCYLFACVGDEFETFATTDNNGRARFTAVAGNDTGSYGVRATLASGFVADAHADIKQVDSDPHRYKHYQDMWWGGTAENGWGMSVIQQGLSLFTVIFAYDSQGKPTWFVMPSGTWDATSTKWTGALYQPHGSWWFAYDVSKFVPGAPVGNATITFSPAIDSARLDYTINGHGGSKPIVRQPFGASTGASGSIGGMWWRGPSQNGWGLAILEQTPKIFPILYTYDETGAPIWFVVPDGTWSLSWRLSGNLYTTTGSPWVGQTYDPSLLQAKVFGPFVLDILSGSSAMLNISDGTKGVSGGIFREQF